MQTPAQLAEKYEQFYQQNSFNYDPNGLYEPVRHIMSIPGKRIRPMFVLMAADMFGGDLTEALNPAFAMEVFHNFTLVHDDVMDNADIRRGSPTVHVKYGLNGAILAGDVMLSYGYKYLLNIADKHLKQSMHLFTKTAIEIFEGQQLDLDFEKRLDVTVDEYLQMIKFKTSVLLATSLQIGALVAGADAEDQQKLYEFGLNLGLSFQIKDDWLDTFGEGEKVGKKIGGDIIQNKKTFLLITALNDATEEQRNQLLVLFQEKEEAKKVAGVMALFSALNISAKTENRINELYEKSLKSLRSVNLPDEKKQPLLALAEKIHNRDY
jgi:geranylgeranyl diphosphate synthase type II